MWPEDIFITHVLRKKAGNRAKDRSDKWYTPPVITYCVTVHLDRECKAVNSGCIYGQGGHPGAFPAGAAATCIETVNDSVKVTASMCKR
jgi:hypothetical protein